MQKSAHSATLATRLNNLEQKFDELNDDPSELNLLLMRLAKMTVEGSQISGSMYDAWESMEYHFDEIGYSIPRAIFGDGVSQSHRYEFVKYRKNLWSLIFGNFIDDEIISSGVVPSVYGRILGYEFVNKFGTVFEDTDTVSLCKDIFGNIDNLDDLREGFLGSLQNNNLFDALKQLFVEVYEVDGIRQRLSNLESRMSNLESRVTNLENN